MRRTLRFATAYAGAALALSVLLVAPAAAQDAQFYVLDGFGGVHSGNGAPVISPATPYFGWDIARDMVYVPKGIGGATGDGLLVLDGFGGVHSAGAMAADPPSPPPPYFGFDIARAIAYRNIPPRINRASNSGGVTVTSSMYTSIESTTIHAPDDGFVLVIATAKMFCNGTGPSEATISLGLDSQNSLIGFDWLERIPDCNPAGSGTTFTVNYVFQVTAGSHTIHLLARDRGATRSPAFGDIVVSVVFVDQDATGGS